MNEPLNSFFVRALFALMLLGFLGITFALENIFRRLRILEGESK